jgi:hypothetical protein
LPIGVIQMDQGYVGDVVYDLLAQLCQVAMTSIR